MFLQILQCPEEPQRSICCHPGRSRISKVSLVHLGYHSVQNIQAVLLVFLLQYNAGKSDKCIAAYCAIPRITCNHLCATTRTTYDKLTSRVMQATQEVNLVSTTCQRCLVYLGDGFACCHLVGCSREDNALTLLD